MSQLEKVYGVHAVEALLRHHPKRVKQLWLAEGRHDPRVQVLLDLAGQHRIEVGQKDRHELDEWAEGVHQGVVAEVSPSQVWGENLLDELLERTPGAPLLLALDGVTDPHNLGACLRTADAAGVLAVIVPKDKSATLNATVRKVACGAAEVMPLVAVTNLSTSRMLEDVAARAGATVVRTKVGEANVVDAMQQFSAVVGGEGNGGVMYPALHIGRDAPLGVALILHLLATNRSTVSQQVAGSPTYTIVKAKGPRGPELRPMYDRLRQRFADAQADERDGLRLSWADRWLHVRPSGTEPIVRLIAEAPSPAEAEALVAAGRELLH